jgi:hypothetical protein
MRMIGIVGRVLWATGVIGAEFVRICLGKEPPCMHRHPPGWLHDAAGDSSKDGTSVKKGP